MKGFIGSFAICFILSIVFLVLFGNFVFKNIYGLIALTSIIFAVLITVLMSLSDKIETLEKRIEKLEKDFK